MPAETDSIKLPLSLKQQMLKHACAFAKVEVCGLLGGNKTGLRHYYPVENIAEEPALAYYMSPQGQLDAMRSMDKRGEALAGIFHSHPDSEAEPSRTDLELAAYPDVIYFIAGFRAGVPYLNSFRYDGRNFSRITIKETSS